MKVSVSCSPFVAAAVSEIEGSTGRAIGHVVDIADEDAVAGLFAEIGEPIWGLVNNAAMADAVGGASFWEIDRSTWDQLLAVNLTGTWLVSKHAAPQLIEQGAGRIINLASDAKWANMSVSINIAEDDEVVTQDVKVPEIGATTELPATAKEIQADEGLYMTIGADTVKLLDDEDRRVGATLVDMNDLPDVGYPDDVLRVLQRNRVRYIVADGASAGLYRIPADPSLYAFHPWVRPVFANPTVRVWEVADYRGQADDEPWPSGDWRGP